MSGKYFSLPASLMLALTLAMPLTACAQTPTQAPAAQTAATRPAPIDRNSMLILIRSTLLALDQANKTDNYTVLRDIGSPAFQVNTAARLAAIFAKHREMNLDLIGVAVAEPEITVPPQIDAKGILRMAGVLQLGGTRVNFELLFVPVENRWRLFGLAVDPGQRPEAKKSK